MMNPTYLQSSVSIAKELAESYLPAIRSFIGRIVEFRNSFWGRQWWSMRASMNQRADDRRAIWYLVQLLTAASLAAVVIAAL